MGKILGLVFNRWTLGALLLLAFLAVLWLIGPLVAVGEWRPLESTTSRWVVTLVVLLFVLALVVWKIVRAKQGNKKVVEQLAAAPAGGGAAAESPRSPPCASASPRRWPRCATRASAPPLLRARACGRG
ncbi:MAG: hypothetical protein U1F25_15475 [Rubrivivax sp.]